MIEQEFDPIDDDRNDDGKDSAEEMAREMREMFQQASRALHNSLSNAARRERMDSALVMERSGNSKTPFLTSTAMTLQKLLRKTALTLLSDVTRRYIGLQKYWAEGKRTILSL